MQQTSQNNLARRQGGEGRDRDREKEKEIEIETETERGKKANKFNIEVKDFEK